VFIFSALSAQNQLSAYGDKPPPLHTNLSLSKVAAGFIPAHKRLGSIISILQFYDF
jgi:hypothetical protein